MRIRTSFGCTTASCSFVSYAQSRTARHRPLLPLGHHAHHLPWSHTRHRSRRVRVGLRVLRSRFVIASANLIQPMATSPSKSQSDYHGSGALFHISTPYASFQSLSSRQANASIVYYPVPRLVSCATAIDRYVPNCGVPLHCVLLFSCQSRIWLRPCQITLALSVPPAILVCLLRSAGVDAVCPVTLTL